MAMLFARIDKRFGAVGALFRRVLSWVKPGAPGVTQYVNIVDRVAPAAHCPYDLIHVGGINIFIDRNDPLRVIGAARHLGGESECLCSVTGVALLERNRSHAKAAGAGRVCVDSLDSRDAEFI